MKKKKKNLSDSFLEENKLIFKKYKPIKKIGKGAFGNIYSAVRIKDKSVFAMKTEKIKVGIKDLETEAYYLFILKGFGIPKIVSYGHSKKYNILIETLLDKSLNDIFIKKDKKCNITDLCLIGLQLMDRIEWIHSKNIIYRDIKPENFLIGIKDPNVIYIIDFGLCKKYRSSKTGKHILPKLTGKFSGNIKFSSPNVLKGKESSRRDDLISIGYLLIYLFKKELPWDYSSNENSNCLNYYEILYLKDTNANGKLFRNIPPELVEYINYTRNLKFEQDPDYPYLRSLFNKIIFNLNISYKNITFSWINYMNIGLQSITRNNSRRKSSPQYRLLKEIKENRSKRLKSEVLGDIQYKKELEVFNTHLKKYLPEKNQTNVNSERNYFDLSNENSNIYDIKKKESDNSIRNNILKIDEKKLSNKSVEKKETNLNSLYLNHPIFSASNSKKINIYKVNDKIRYPFMSKRQIRINLLKNKNNIINQKKAILNSQIMKEYRNNNVNYLFMNNNSNRKNNNIKERRIDNKYVKNIYNDNLISQKLFNNNINENNINKTNYYFKNNIPIKKYNNNKNRIVNSNKRNNIAIEINKYNSLNKKVINLLDYKRPISTEMNISSIKNINEKKGKIKNNNINNKDVNIILINNNFNCSTNQNYISPLYYSGVKNNNFERNNARNTLIKKFNTDD